MKPGLEAAETICEPLRALNIETEDCFDMRVDVPILVEVIGSSVSVVCV